MTKVRIYNTDGTRATCPNGASVQFPVGTIRRVNVGDDICMVCPCHCSQRYDPVAPYVECAFNDKQNPET